MLCGQIDLHKITAHVTRSSCTVQSSRVDTLATSALYTVGEVATINNSIDIGTIVVHAVSDLKFIVRIRCEP